jgi:hypothetical protein
MSIHVHEIGAGILPAFPEFASWTIYAAFVNWHFRTNGANGHANEL